MFTLGEFLDQKRSFLANLGLPKVIRDIVKNSQKSISPIQQNLLQHGLIQQGP